MRFVKAFLIAYVLQTIIVSIFAPILFGQPVILFSSVRVILVLLLTYFMEDEILKFYEYIKNKFKNN